MLYLMKSPVHTRWHLHRCFIIVSLLLSMLPAAAVQVAAQTTGEGAPLPIKQALPPAIGDNPFQRPVASDAALGGIEDVSVSAASVTAWGAAPDMPTPRAGAQVIADIYGNIYTFGGRDQAYQVTNVVEVYVPAEDRWYCSYGDSAPGCAVIVLPPLPTARTNMAVAVHWSQGYFFLIGGLNAANRVVNTIEAYSLYDQTWYCSIGDTLCSPERQLLNPLPTPRAFAIGATGPDGGIYVIGGLDDNQSITSVIERWDPYTGEWSCSAGDNACPAALQTIAPLPTPRAALGAAAGATGDIYVVGGVTDLQTFTALNTVEVYNVYANRWFCSSPVIGCEAERTVAPLPTPRSDLAVTVGPDGWLYAVGGAQGVQTLASVESYNPDTNLWRTNEALPTTLVAGAAVTSLGKLFVVGGQTAQAISSVIGDVNTYTPPPPATPSLATVAQHGYPSTFLPLSQSLLTLAARYDGNPTNTAFGNYTYQHTDLSLPGFGPEVRITRTYTSAFPRRGVFGWGWNSTFEMSLTLEGATAKIKRHDGRIDLYALNNGVWTPPQGSVDTLTANGDGTYSLATRQHLTYRFDGQGRLTQVRDDDGNTVTLQYSGSQWSGIRDASGRQWTLSYNAQGLVSSITDPAGRTSSYSYDARQDLISVTDPAGGVIQYLYDTYGYHQLLAVFDANDHRVVANWYTGSIDPATGQWYGRIVRQLDNRDQYHFFYYFQGVTAYVDPTAADSWTFYDQTGQVSFRIDPLGDLQQFAYTGALINEKTDGNGGVTRYTYDSRGNLTRTEDPLGNVTLMTYDGRDNLLQKVDPLGSTTTWRYNAANHPVEMTDAQGGTTSYSYDALGRLIRETDPLGNTKTYTYDVYGNRTAITDALGRTTRFTYYATGMVNTKTDPSGRVTTSEYDAMNRPIAVTTPDGGVTRTTYDAVGNRLTVTDPRGNITTFSYTTANEVATKLDALGYQTSYTYDAVGREISHILPDGSQWTKGYDLAGRLVQETSPLCNQNAECERDPVTYCDTHAGDCHTTRYTYDANGNRLSVINPLQQKTQFFYDLNDRPVAVVDALNNTTSYEYDAAGNHKVTTDARGNKTRYLYDALNRRIAEFNPLGQFDSIVYDALGRVTRSSNGAAEEVTRTYDAGGQLLTLTANGVTTRFTYDLAGNRSSMSDATGLTSYTYDTMNRLSSVSGPRGAVSYSYDLAGNRTALRQPDLEITYAYDALNRLSTVQVGAQLLTTYTYDAVGRKSGRQDANGVATQFGYDAEGRLISLVTNGAGGELQRITYALDALGNRTSETATEFAATYRYDALNQLTDATLDYTAAAPAPTATPTATPAAPPATPAYRTLLPLVRNGASGAVANADDAMLAGASDLQPAGFLTSAHRVYAYRYDAVGNRISVTENGAATTYTYDSANRLSAAGSQPITYDAAGRLVSDGSNQYGYDAYNRLTNITGGAQATFLYDGDGNRVGEVVQGVAHTFLIDTAAPLPVRIATTVNGRVDRLIYGAEPLLELTAESSRRYLHGDGLGSLRLRTTAAGALIDRSAYAPTGQRLTGDGVLGFTGEPYVGDGLLVHLRARDYHTGLGRFLTQDPHPADLLQPQTFHEYAYALNNPVNLTDPTGESVFGGFENLFGMAMGGNTGAFGMSSNTFSCALTGYNCPGAMSSPYFQPTTYASSQLYQPVQSYNYPSFGGASSGFTVPAYNPVLNAVPMPGLIQTSQATQAGSTSLNNLLRIPLSQAVAQSQSYNPSANTLQSMYTNNFNPASVQTAYNGYNTTLANYQTNSLQRQQYGFGRNDISNHIRWYGY